MRFNLVSIAFFGSCFALCLLVAVYLKMQNVSLEGNRKLLLFGVLLVSVLIIPRVELARASDGDQDE